MLEEVGSLLHRSLPERVKHWYANRSDGSKPSSSSPATKEKMREKNSVKGQSTVKTKEKASMDKPEKIKQTTKGRSSAATVKNPLKRAEKLKESLPRTRSGPPTAMRPEKKPSKILAGTEKEKNIPVARVSLEPLETPKIAQIPELPNIQQGLSSFHLK